MFVHTDSELLSLVWNNLFSNAIKFTAPGGRIGLTLRARGADAVVEVSDTGCGISPEVGRHIFEKFYQGDTSHATQGNGLGLALVRRVVDIVGGSITVHSEVGRGSRFTVTLRRKPMKSRSNAAAFCVACSFPIRRLWRFVCRRPRRLSRCCRLKRRCWPLFPPKSRRPSAPG